MIKGFSHINEGGIDIVRAFLCTVPLQVDSTVVIFREGN